MGGDDVAGVGVDDGDGGVVDEDEDAFAAVFGSPTPRGCMRPALRRLIFPLPPISSLLDL